jgi:imidazolonepropionase|tara:strand:+ start:3478 stop:4719 length:1242 start_codon:yes stop_codon:yes gene_type:complete
MNNSIIIGPFKQILTMDRLPDSGPIRDDSLEIISNGSVLIENQNIVKILPKNNSKKASHSPEIKVDELQEDAVLMPGLIDAHTHICYAGTREEDYARRLSGESYLEIAKQGGGILNTVRKTRAASQQELEQSLMERARTHLLRGVTTCEVKSGYGLTKDAELKMLRAIHALNQKGSLPDLVPTCLAAHVKPEEFQDHNEYLNYILHELLPAIKSENLSDRVDIFIEEGAFNPEISLKFLKQAKASGFSVTIHADQFSKGGSEVASKVGAISADHLETSEDREFEMLKSANVIANVLPGASTGLGMPFAPVRKMLNAGLTVTISSDWNPGSAPMGDLLTLASMLGADKKLTTAETLSALTNRAAKALELNDRGLIKTGYLADMIAYPCSDYREILYHQGSLKPHRIWKNGEKVK